MRRPGICLLILFCSLRAIAIDAVISHTFFYNPDGSGKLKPVIETYWQVNPNTLHYITNPDHKIQASFRTDIVFTNDAGTIAQEHYILKTVPLSGVDEIMQHSIIDLRRYELPEGLVRMKFRLTDLGDSINRFIYTDSFTVHAPSKPVFYSGIELLDSMLESAAGKTIFTKNGKLQVPACTNFYDNGMNNLRYYAELYGSHTLAKSDYPLLQRVSISKNPTEGFYAGFQKTDTIRAQQPILHAGGNFKIASLPSGNYYLRMTIENSAHIVIASENLFFQRLNKHPLEDSSIRSASISDTGIENVTILNLKKTFIAKYNLAEIRAILKMLLPVSDPQATNTINAFLKKPDEIYMRYYIYNYFAAISKDNPGGAWKEYSKKVAEVNKLYNTHNTRGYETDRGFIYLRYGAPTDIITVENEEGSLPYEIWQYNTLMQMNNKAVPDALFLFYRPSQMFSDFKLLHSTVTGEVQNSQWRMSLYVSPGQTNFSGSRAEQYIGTR
jgi:GWxTD domain-containing protein